MDFEEFKEKYKKNNNKNIDMNLYIYQKYYVQYNIIEKKILNYVSCIDLFKNEYKDIDFKITEDSFQKIKTSILGSVKNKTIEDICKSLKYNNNDNIVEIYPINTEFKNHNNIIEKRNQNIILIGNKEMITYLNSEKATQYGIDCTYRIIPRSYKPYKLLTIYAIDTIKNKSIIAAIICIKYTDYESFKKLFSLLNAIYYFSPVCITTDFSFPQIKALKDCHSFKKKPYIICCIFHYSQCILKKLKEYKIIKKKINKHAYEILRNLEFLCFIDIRNIKPFFNNLKDKYNQTEGDIKLMNYIEKNWISKDPLLYNYSELIKDIIKTKNLYINKNYDKNSEKTLISKLKSIQKVFFSNNICESMHSKIAKNLPSGAVTKTNFRDTLDYTLKHYYYKTRQILRRDYITRSCIIAIEKYKVNETKNPISYICFLEELKKTVAIMTGKTNLKAVEEVINYIEDIEEKEDESEQEKDINEIECNKIEVENEIDEDMNIEKNKNLIKENMGNNSSDNDEDIFEGIDENEIKKEIVIISKEKDNYLKNYDIMGSNNSSENESGNDNDSNNKSELDSNIEEDNENYFDVNNILTERKELNLFTIDFNENYENKIKLLIKEENKLIINDKDERKEDENSHDEDLGSLESKINKLDLNKKGKKKFKNNN